MRIFLSYSSKDRPLVQRIGAALNAAGFDTFVDTHDLPPGQEYNARLKMAIEDADLFIFLASDHSVEPGSYALTELSFAERKWRNPAGHVLPVLLEGFDPGQLPAYLRPINGLRIHGNPEAEVVGWVQDRVEHGSIGVPGLLTPGDRLRRWARLAQPPLRPGRRVLPCGSVFGIFLGVLFLLFAAFAYGLIGTGGFGPAFGPAAAGLFLLVMSGVPLLMGIVLISLSLWSTLQGLRQGGTPVPVVILGRSEERARIELETLEGKRLSLYPATKGARQVHAGDLGWGYIRGGMLVEFIPASSENADSAPR